MIKIIKEGKLPKKYFTKYEITCPYCKTVFECDKEDITYIIGPYGIHVVDCPFCKNKINLRSCNYKTYEIEQKEKEE